MMFWSLALAAIWVWSPERLPERNSYVEFRSEFQSDGRLVTLRVAAGGEFHAEVNGAVATFGTYRDFPDHPTYNEVTVPTKKGSNALHVGVFHSGNGFGSHADGSPGLWVEVVDANGRMLVATGGAGWCCRPMANYAFGDLPVTFGTLDWTYEYDAGKSGADWCEPVAAAPHAAPAKRPVGVPHYGTPLVGREVYRAAGMVGFDLGDIACGHLEFRLQASAGMRIRVRNHEYLTDGLVKSRAGVHPGDVYVADGVEATFRHDYRLYGCRYIAFEYPTNAQVRIVSVKLHPVLYDGFETPSFDCDDEFFRKAHAASAKTLRLCWLGRHVSNIWREQAWYPFDLRFEALYGYTLWGLYDETAANLEQVGRGVLSNGFMPAVGPAVKDPERCIWIPMYTFSWMSSLAEHYLYSGDDRLFRQFAGQIRSTLEKVFALKKDGLYLPPDGMLRWDYCDPVLDDWVGSEVNPPNAFYNLYLREALMLLAPLYRSHGESAYAEKLERIAKAIGERCVARYWDEDKGLYADRVDEAGRKLRFHSHIQYLFLQQGLVPAERRTAFIDRLLQFDLPFRSLASLRFLCEGILEYGTEKQLEKFHAIVKRTFSPMLDHELGTYWEAADGVRYASNGCLCQGWSSFPAWYEAHVLLGVRPTKPGFAAYERNPRLLGGMKRVSGQVMTPNGAIEVDATR